MSIDSTRIAEARQGLQAVDQNPHRHDPAIRIVDLESPRPNDDPLVLHPNLVIIAGLSEAAQQSIAATVDGIRLRNPNIGLVGRAQIRGRRRPLASLGPVDRRPGAGLASPTLFAGSPETNLYLEVVESAERAIQLSVAELRGAAARRGELEAQREELTNSIAQRSATGVAGDERTAMLATIDEVALPVEVTDELRVGLAALDADPQRVALRAAVEQAEAAKARVLPGDGNQATLLADLAIAEADGSLAAYDVTPGGAADELHRTLERLGLSDTPDRAPEIASRVVAETAELRAMQVRLTQELGTGGESVRECHDESQSLLEMAGKIDELRFGIERRLRAQQQLLAIARMTVAELHGEANVADQLGDLSPLLIEDPLRDLPQHLNGAVLSMLLRHSLHRQVICLSDQRSLHAWARSVGGRAGWTEASGWFSRRG